jgi:hypothetical protein
MDLDHDPTWSPLSELTKQVEKEAWWCWAKEEGEPFRVVPPLKGEKWEPASAHAFGRGVYRQLRAVLP